MHSSLYNTDIDCPVCKKKFSVTKVKSKTSKLIKKDTDFCMHYDGINAILYDAWVCENCGYSAQWDKFSEISDKDAALIYKSISTRWNKRSFDGERSNDLAIEAFKLVLLNAQIRKAKASEIAKICLRIAWLYRFKNDEKENEFLKFALNNYHEAYETENFPIEKLDEFTCMYMIAELHRRVGDKDESIKWFSKLISSPEARKNPAIIEAAREQYQIVKG